jgi:hypothetical protein
MDSAATQRLINRILAYWELEPSTLRCRAWEHALQDLDEGRAGTAFAQAKRTQTSISPAAFTKIYSDIKPDTNHLPSCPRCEGTGRNWEPVYVACSNCTGTGKAERPSGPAMSPSKHLTKLNQRAAIGDRKAIEELGAWRRATQSPNPWLNLTNPAIRKALDG